jgi:hypothetical protein
MRPSIACNAQLTARRLGAGLATMVLPKAINFAWIWIIGFGAEYGWLIGDSGENHVPKYVN